MNTKKLILFTDSYPFGWAETFLEAEVEHLCRVFGEVTSSEFLSALFQFCAGNEEIYDFKILLFYVVERS